MAESTKVWCAYVHTFNFAGIDCTQGTGKGGFLELTQLDEAVTLIKGTDGSLVFNQQPAGGLKISATFLQTSSTNAKLTAYFNASQAANGLPGALYYEDRNGTAKVVGVAAMLVKQPDEKIGAEVDDVTWEFLVGDYVRTVGSH